MEDDDRTVMRSSHAHLPEVPRDTAEQEGGGNALPIGTRLGEFEITGLVGEGGFGIVYLAHDSSLDRQVAVKEFMPSGLASRTRTMHVTVRSKHYVDTFKVGLRSFVNEARMLARFDSPSLVKVYRFWEENGTAYMVMPFYDGATLKQALKDGQIVPDERWLRAMLASLLDAIETIHREQCYHRDIAPDNILILRDGRPLLLDFGAARRVIGDVTQGLTVILKPGFAPIEQYADAPGMKQGPWTDIYALAAVVYFMISGKTPPTSVARIVHDDMVPACEVGRGRYSEQFLSVLDKALAVRPEHRIQNVAELRDALGLEEGVPRTMPGMGRAAASPIGSAPAPRWTTEAPRPTGTGTGMGTGTGTAGPAGHLAPDSDEWGPTVYAGERAVPPPEEKRSKTPALIAAAALAVVIGAGVAGYRWMNSGAADPSGAPPLASTTPAAPSTAAMPARTPEPSVAMLTPDNPPAVDRPAPPASRAPDPAAVVPAAPPEPAVASGLSAEDEMWRAAMAKDTPAAYDTYLKRYPRGKHVASARLMLDTGQPRLAAAPSAAAPPVAAAAPAVPLPRAPGGEARGAGSSSAQLQARAVPPPAAPEPERKPAASLVAPPAASAAAAAAPPSTQVVGGNAAATGSGAPANTPGASSAASANAADAPARATELVALTPQPATRAPVADPAKADSVAKALPRAAEPAAAPLPPAAQPVTSGERRTIKLPGQTMTGDFTPDPANGVVSGTGHIAWDHGDRFDGRIVKGLKEGKGQFVWASGQRYTGDWVADMPNGRGVLQFTNGNRYEGEVKNGLPHGRGVMLFGNGNRYEGELREGEPYGQGTTRFVSGDVYTGSWVKGKHQGKGKYTWANGNYWEGEFKDGSRTENGKMVFTDPRTVLATEGTEGAAPAAPGQTK